MRHALIGLAGLLAAGCAELSDVMPEMPELGPAPDSVPTPSWAERAPTADDLLFVYPRPALHAGLEGLVYLDCTVQPARTLACGVGEDTVPGHGFSEAALKVADLFVMKENYPNAGPGARVRVPVRFVVG